MITPSFGLTSTERVLPNLALDFTTASLDSRVTFTRTTGASNPATYLDSSGYIVSAANDQPRFDYDPVTLACKGLLIEETRTNLQRYSTITNANWTKLRSTITDNAITSPLGTTTAPLVACNATGGGMSVTGLQCSQSNNATVTASVYLKKGYDDFALLIVSDPTTSNGARQWVNINTGVLGSSSVFGTGWTKVNATIENAGNGWCRVTFTVTTVGTACNFAIFPSCPADGNASCTSGVTFGYPWGAQLEAGAFATSYIPTTSAALTRNADVATMTGTDFSDWFNASEGTFAVTYIPYSTAASPSQRVIYADDGSTNNRVYFTSTSTNQIAVTSGGVSQAIVAAGTVTANQPNTVAGYYKANAFNIAGNATTGTKDTSGSVPVGVNNLRFFRDAGSTNSLYGHLQKMNFWDIAVTDAELAAFSK